MKRYLIGLMAGLLGTAMITGTGPQTVAAAAPPPTTVTLPLFGAPLTIDITTGPGGALTDVSVDSANATVATHLKPRKVVFETANPDVAGDPGKVVVKSRHGGQSVSARAGSLADVAGPGSWSGDLFGDGTASTVDFTIGAGGDGGPDITGITASAGGVVGDVKRSSVDDDDDELEQSARVSIKFTGADGAQSRTVSIKVRVEVEGDDESEVKLSISVARLKGVAVDAVDAAGPHTWTGTLCDNSAATINYTVAEDGSVSGVTATPDTPDVRTGDHKVDVRFSGDERVRIKIRENDGQIKISVDERLRCDSEDPTTNVSTIPDDDDDDRRGGENNNSGGGGGNDDDDDDTSTTAAGG